MSLHHPLPVVLRIQRRVLRLAADGGRVEQHFRPHQRHRPRAFREPLVPADRAADRADPRRPDAEAGIAGIEVELLLLARAVGRSEEHTYELQSLMRISYAV